MTYTGGNLKRVNYKLRVVILQNIFNDFNLNIKKIKNVSYNHCEMDFNYETFIT